MNRGRANTMLLAVAFIWGSGNVAQKMAIIDVGPFTMQAVRGVLGLVAISPWLIKECRSTEFLPARTWLRLLAAGVALSVPLTLQQVAARHQSATNLSFLLNTTVIFTPVLSWLGQRRRPAPRSCIAALTALAGVWLLSGGPANLQAGDELRLLSAFAYSVWILLVGQVVRSFDCPTLMPACQFVVLAAFGAAGSSIEPPIAASGLLHAGTALAVLGIVSTGLAFTLETIAQRAAATTDAALVMSLAGIFGATAASILTGGGMSRASSVGASTMIAAIMINEFGGSLKLVRIRLQLRPEVSVLDGYGQD